MITIRLQNENFKIPSEPSEISLDLGLNIQYIWHNQEKNIETKLEILNILMPSILWKELTDDSIDNIIKQLNFIEFNKQTQFAYNKVFKFKKKIFGLHKLHKLTVNEYSDIEFYLSYGESPLENIDKICSILYRPLKSRIKTLKNILLNKIRLLFFRNIIPLDYVDYELEEYNDVKHLNNSDLMRSELPFSFGLSTLLIYYDYKNKLISDYPDIFGVNKNKEIDPFEEEEKKYIEEHKSEFKKTFEETWGFYHILVECASDLRERDIWLTRDIKEFFKYLAYVNAKAINDYNKNKQR